jgi:Putative zinc-finger
VCCSIGLGHVCARAWRGISMADSSHVEHMYACREVVELVSEYLEGAMTPEQMTRFELHLNLCDGCATFLEQIRLTAAMAGGMSEEHIPDEMKSKLLAAFREWGRE